MTTLAERIAELPRFVTNTGEYVDVEGVFDVVTDSLDAAWSEVEAALRAISPSAAVELLGPVAGGYAARALDGQTLPSLAAAGGRSPTAALRALTKELRER